MPNFSIALTGLQSDTVALNTIGNNLANLNTTAFKDGSTSFQDLFYQNIGITGSGDQLQVGVGTRVAATASDFSQGSLATTGTATDMALSGSGFFVVQNGGAESLTRAGNFTLSSTGTLQTTEGEAVMGYGALNGAVNYNAGVLPITLPVASIEAASATSNMSITTSLNATAQTGATFSSGVTLYDSLGETHLATVTYTKSSPSTWDYSISLPAGDSTGTPINNTGTLTFNSAGQLTSPAGNVTGVSFPQMADGASDLTFNFNVYDPSGKPIVTQTAGVSNATASSQDGFAAGAYQGFSVDGTGLISASFSNGHTAIVGQFAVASVANEEGLSLAGGNEYNETAASGLMTVGTAGVGGRATIQGASARAIERRHFC